MWGFANCVGFLLLDFSSYYFISPVRFLDVFCIQSQSMHPVTIDGENLIPDGKSQESTIPLTCKAGVVSNNGPNYKLTIEDVQVPTPGIYIPPISSLFFL